MYNFGLIGAAGYVAPRHMRAIKETNNDLKVVLDPNDSVGIIDSYFPDSSFFTETERFERHIDKLRRRGEGLDYLSICSPNYLHDSHIRLGLRNGCDIICEKPMVINPQNVKYLSILEKETGKKINNILQLRLHETIVDFKKSIDPSRVYDIDLTYITSRGKWYQYSWKANKVKSGGLAMNIGIHFFDMLIWIFGQPTENIVYMRNEKIVSGLLVLERAKIRWLLSIDKALLPPEHADKRTYRSIRVDDKELEFSSGFDHLHTKSYLDIFNGNGFGSEDVLSSIELIEDISAQTIVSSPMINTDLHPVLRGIK